MRRAEIVIVAWSLLIQGYAYAQTARALTCSQHLGQLFLGVTRLGALLFAHALPVAQWWRLRCDGGGSCVGMSVNKARACSMLKASMPPPITSLRHALRMQGLDHHGCTAGHRLAAGTHGGGAGAYSMVK